MNSEQALNENLGETAQSPEEHAQSCWDVLVRHCQAGRCTCHIGIGGSVHVLSGCVVGLMLFDEYMIASRRSDHVPNLPRGLNGNLSEIFLDECHADAASCDCSYHENMRAAEASRLEPGDFDPSFDIVSDGSPQ